MTIEKTLLFEENTDAEVIRFTHLQNSSTWKGELASEEYAEREWILGHSPIGEKAKSSEAKQRFPNGFKQLGMKYFVLKDLKLDGSTKTSQIVSSCEVLNRLGYCIRPGGDGSIEPCLIGTIGGVFTIDEHRGKGYARKMIDLLNEHFDGIRSDVEAPNLLKNMVITLYSEVGEYYAKSGYKSEHVPVHTITQLDQFEDRYCEQTSEGHHLGFDGYQNLILLEDERFKSDLKKLHRKNPDKFIFTVAPDIDIYKWFAHRDLFIMEKTNRAYDNLNFGFVLKDSSHIFWHHHWSEGCLWIVKVYIEEGPESPELILKKLFKKAVDEAKNTGLQSILFWDQEVVLEEFLELSEVMFSMEHDSKVYANNTSLSAFRPPHGIKADQVIWSNNTKFCWF